MTNITAYAQLSLCIADSFMLIFNLVNSSYGSVRSQLAKGE